jgi:exo-1,4-beta-D-glucosaminidase
MQYGRRPHQYANPDEELCSNMGQCIGKKRRGSVWVQAATFLLAIFAMVPTSSRALQTAAQGEPDAALVLHDGWGLHSGFGFFDNGDRISKREYNDAGWRSINVPSTVLAAQVASGEFKDPYYARNLRHIPGTGYPIGEIFSNLPMPQNSPYRCAWWYRRLFHVKPMQKGGHLWLHFAGINYRANIWLNGKLVANDTQIAGAYRVYDLDVTGAAAKDGENTLAIEVYAPHENDLGINWVDWNPSPPDKNMGLVGSVSVRVAGPVLLRAPTVATHFTDQSLSTAELTVYAELRNSSSAAVDATVEAELLGMHLSKPVKLAPWETVTVTFTPHEFPSLRIQHPQIWWPYQMGTPHLETLKMSVKSPNGSSGDATTRFGIREMTSELTANNSRLFKVNGKPVMIRGGGWSQDMLLREDPQRLAQQFDLVQDLHLNAIRLEGKLETQEFLQMADERGILILAGWCCCDQWEHWKDWTPENFAVAADSVRSQMLRLRSHASVLVWLNGSDNSPIPFVENAYLRIEKEEMWPNPTLSAASSQNTVVSGKNGVKMTGPYDYVGPSYWYADKDKYGGAYGFNTETSPGPAVMMESSLRRFLPTDQMVPESPDWQYHNGSGHFTNLTVFDTAMNHTYGTPPTLDGYERYAQTMAFDGERAMYEAYDREKYLKTTGIVQWMLNNAWPSNIWHLYDSYLDAGGGYYGARDANEPLHVQYSYDDHSIVVVNSMYAAGPPMQVVATVYDLKIHPLYTHTAPLTPGPDSSTTVYSLPASLFAEANGLNFVKLALVDAHGTHLSDNFYWVPSKLTTFAWAKTDFTHTPALTYPDMTALASLPPATLSAKLSGSGKAGELALILKNTSQALAFQVYARALDSHGETIDPAYWSDSYIELMPGESRTLHVHLDSEQKGERIAEVTVSGWNVAPQKLSAGGR